MDERLVSVRYAGLCRGSGAQVGGRQGASNRGKHHPCPVCGRSVGMRPGRRGTLYNHAFVDMTGYRKFLAEDKP